MAEVAAVEQATLASDSWVKKQFQKKGKDDGLRTVRESSSLRTPLRTLSPKRDEKPTVGKVGKVGSFLKNYLLFYLLRP